MLLVDVFIGCRTSVLDFQRPASLDPASPLPGTVLAASSWAPLLPRLCYDPQQRYFQRMSPCSCTTKAFVLSQHPSPLYPRFGHSTVFLGRHASGKFRQVHLRSSWFGRCVPSSSAQSLPFLQRTLVSRTLGRAGQTFSNAVFILQYQLLCLFFFKSKTLKPCGRGTKRIFFFGSYCFFTWFGKHGHVVIPRMKCIPQYPVSCWWCPIVLSAPQLLLIAIACCSGTAPLPPGAVCNHWATWPCLIPLSLSPWQLTSMHLSKM